MGRQADVRHAEGEIPNPVQKADPLHVGGKAANLIDRHCVWGFLTGQQSGYLYPWAVNVLAMMDAAESAGRPLIIVFADEGRLCLDSDRRWVRHRG
jgi:hypothetical protein